MKQLACLGHETVELRDVPIPEPGPDQVLVKTVVSALCGSEMNAYRNTGVDTGNLGHEAAGIVQQVGADVTNLAPGTRVGVSAIAGCGQCPQCHAGRYTWCDNFTFFGNMHAEYFIIPALACHILPDDVPWDVAVLITGDGLGVPYHTSTKINHPEIHTIAVFGLGPIGLGNTLLQTHLGRGVIGIDRSQKRLNLARQLGAVHVIHADDNPVQQIEQFTAGNGADVCIEAAGLPVTARHCFRAVRKGGTVVFNGEQPHLDLSPSNDFIRRDIHALGCWFYHFHEFNDMLALYRAGLDVQKLITHQLPLAQAHHAYQLMRQGVCAKVLLKSHTPNPRPA